MDNLVKDKLICQITKDMLCATECTTFTVRNDLDINAIKAEVEREIEDERYINAEAEGYINDTDDTAL